MTVKKEDYTELKILNRQRLYILGVSGGPDSMFLLDNLRQKGYKIIVAHVNYRKREESSQDEELVKKYCQIWNLPCFVCSIKPNDYLLAKNFQSWAREKRYNFFQKIARQKQTKYVITAHHLDDHLETYLFQKQRKSLVEH
jgi:tRNA(Ile)-lysidine synthetase-like protein